MKNISEKNKILFGIALMVVIIFIVGLLVTIAKPSTKNISEVLPQTSPLVVKAGMDSNALSTDQFSIELPEIFMSLKNHQSNELNTGGCVVYSSSFTCVKDDPEGGNVVFGYFAEDKPVGVTNDEFLRKIRSQEGAERKEIKKSLFGFDSIVVTQKINVNGQRVLRDISFFRNNKLYYFSFVASEKTFYDQWSHIEQAIEGIRFK